MLYLTGQKLKLKRNGSSQFVDSTWSADALATESKTTDTQTHNRARLSTFARRMLV